MCGGILLCVSMLLSLIPVPPILRWLSVLQCDLPFPVDNLVIMLSKLAPLLEKLHRHQHCDSIAFAVFECMLGKPSVAMEALWWRGLNSL